MTPKRAGSLMTAFRSPGLGSAKMTATSSALYTDRSNADCLHYDKNASRGILCCLLSTVLHETIFPHLYHRSELYPDSGGKK
jgi:hypothetical protein